MKKWLIIGLGIFTALTLVTGYLINKEARKPVRTIYQNPVLEPDLADPSIIHAADGYFYAYGTENDWGDGHGNRLVPIIRSKNMTNWEIVGDAFSKKPAWHDYGGIWAPDISFYNDKYYLYYSMSVWADTNPGIGVATSDKPQGPFEDKGVLFTSEDIEVPNSIDPMRFSEDGDSYLFWGSFRGIYGIRLSEDGFSAAGEKFHIAGSFYEATYIIKRNGYYYFFGSIGSCCEGAQSGYHVAVGRAKALNGPYLDQQGNDLKLSRGTLFLSGSSPDLVKPEEKAFVGAGHVSVMADDEGTDWLVYHAVDSGNSLLPNEATRRPLMIDPIVWKDGWPMLEDGEPTSVQKPGPIWK